MENVERLASFYLGQQYDLTKGESLDEIVQYDARDLTTHAVCLGMTGSGKTGLGIIMIEEAALDGVPSLIIDPKGDMTNLLLTFPELRPEDFRPWVNPDDARRKGLELDEFAATTAENWRKGLAGSGQGPDRIRRLKESADFAIYTPGSSAGRQVSILSSLKAPDLSFETDNELLRDKIESVVSALLALVNIQADPMRSREHILLSNIFDQAWRAGEDLDLPQLIMRVQTPPFSQLGVFPVDTFYPEKDRMALAMLLNGLMASPAFADWIQGQPLEIGQFLKSPSGKPQVSIMYIAHLSESERQFFVTLLLEEVVMWMRRQSGTTSLRAMLYMDEMFGYLPPHPGNPPTKKPLLTLLKQARAFGLGLVLATQNPVDLDYKALANCGTWMIGRMQTDRDKQRLLDGLEGVQVTEAGLKRSDFDNIISALRSRMFLLHNVHQDHPIIFYTRWAMSYLRGPLTRLQVKELVGQQPPAPVAEAASQPRSAEPSTAQPVAQPRQTASPEPKPGLPYLSVPPQLPSTVEQVFLPPTVSFKAAMDRLAREQTWSVQPSPEQQPYLVYEPALLGTATVRFEHTKSRQNHAEDVAYLLTVEDRARGSDWSTAQVELETRRLERTPERGAFFAELPSELGEARQYTTLKKDFEDYLYYNTTVNLFYHPHLKLYSKIGESESQFERRYRKAAEEIVDDEVKKLAGQYKSKLDRVEDRLRSQERQLDKEKTEHEALKQEELLSGVESVIGLFSKRKSSTRLSTASRRRRMTQQAKADVEKLEGEIADLQKEMEELAAEAAQEEERLRADWADRIEEVETVEVRPRRADVRLDLFALAWLPRWELAVGGQRLSALAYEVPRI